jgi:hypothetical protein
MITRICRHQVAFHHIGKMHRALFYNIFEEYNIKIKDHGEKEDTWIAFSLRFKARRRTNNQTTKELQVDSKILTRNFSI